MKYQSKTISRIFVITALVSGLLFGIARAISTPSFSSFDTATTSIVAHWGTVSGASYYNVSTTASGQIIKTTDLDTTITGLTPSTAYIYQIEAVDGEGVSSGFSTPTTTYTIPTTPSISGFSPITTSGIQINWQTVAEAVYYTVSSTAGTVTTTATTSSFAGLTPNTSYLFQVSTHDVYGQDSAFSPVASTSTENLPQLAPPIISGFTNTTSTIQVLWDPITGASYYVITRATAQVVTSNSSTIGTNTTADYLLPWNRFYNYSASEMLYVKDEIGVGAGPIDSVWFYKDSGSTTTTVNDVTIYLKQTSSTDLTTGVADTAGYTQIYTGSFPNNVSSGWVGVSTTAFNYNGTDNIQMLIVKGNEQFTPNRPYYRYTTTSAYQARYYYHDTNAFSSGVTSLTQTLNRPNIKFGLTLTAVTGTIETVTTTDTNYIFTNLSPSTTYYFQIRSVDEIEQSSVSSSVTSTFTETPPAPATPVITSTTPSTSTVHLSWDGVYGAIYYTVSSTAGTVTTTHTTSTISGLTPSTTYYFQVKAHDAYNQTSGFSDATSTTTDVTPVPDAPVIASFSRTTSSLQINWNIVQYAQYYTVSSTAGGTVTTTQVSSTFSGLTPSTTYYFQINAVDMFGRASNFSNVSSTATGNLIPPSTPTITSIQKTFSSLWVFWDSISGAAFYTVSSTAGTVTTTQTNYLFSGLTASTTYYLQIKSTNAYGQESSYSTITSTRTGSAPSFVNFVTIGTTSTIFSYTGSMQTYSVPSAATRVFIEAYGAEGGTVAVGLGGRGGYAQGFRSVSSGETLYVYVGQQGQVSDSVNNQPTAFNGGGSGHGTGTGSNSRGGGGGASDVRIGSTATSSRIIVAGGGGGAYTTSHGGNGGGTSGGAGSSGGGGTQSAGGTSSYCSPDGTGSLGLGGSSICSNTVCGGGGGYYGGGAGNSAGGGSSYIGGVTSGSTTAGLRSGDGLVTISASTTISSDALVATTSTNFSGYVTLVSKVSDADGDAASITYRYSVGECGSFSNNLATTTLIGTPSSTYGQGNIVLNNATSTGYQLSNITTASGTNTVTTTWDSKSQIPTAENAVYCIYAVISDGSATSTVATTTVTIDNIGRPIVGNAIRQVFSYTGSLQTYQMPSGFSTFHMEASGAQGGSHTFYGYSGGYGAYMSGDFGIQAGTTLYVVVGGRGESTASNLTNAYAAGGGGGSFVYSTSTLYLAAGGGGGRGYFVSATSSQNAVTTTNGINGYYTGFAAGGTNGNGGAATTYSGGGAGWLSNGSDSSYGKGGKTSSSSWAGGLGFLTYPDGGYGGGGGAYAGGGGGGGYSGGGAGGYSISSGSGGGGGSYNIGTNQINRDGDQSDDGQVVFTLSNGVTGLTATHATDGTGGVIISQGLVDQQGDPLSITYRYKSGSCTAYDGSQATTTLLSTVSSTYGQGSIVVNNAASNGYQLSSVYTSSGENIVTTTWDTKSQLPSANGVYCLYVIAYDGSTTSAAVTTTVTLDNVAPSQTNISSFSSTATTITINWSAVSGASYYTVSSTAGSVSTTALTSITYSGLTPLTSYRFQVQAADSYGNTSTYSTASSTQTTGVSAPTISSFSNITTTSIRVNWSAVSGASYYTVSSTAGSVTTTGVNSTFSGLSPYTSYSFQMQATDASGATSTWSSVTSSVTLIPDVLSPSNITNLVSGTSTVNVYWNAIDGAAYYIISRSTSITNDGGTVASQIGTGVSSYSYSTEMAPVNRYYNYSAEEMLYLKDEIGAGNTTTINRLEFYKDSGSTVTITGLSVYLKSTTSTSLSTDTSTLTGYTLVYSGSFPNSGTSGWVGITTTDFGYNAVDNLQILFVKGNQTFVSGGPTYRYTNTSQYQARYYANDNVAWSSSVTLTQSLKRPNIKIFYSDSLLVNPTTVTTSASNYLISGLSPSTTYYFTVNVVDIYGQISASSTVMSTSTLRPPPPAVPTITSSTPNTSTIQISWDAVYGATYYMVSSTAGGTVTTTQVSSTFSGLTPSTTYYFQVKAYDAYSQSSTFSNIYTTSTVLGPVTNPPTISSFSDITTTSIEVSWGTVPWASYYTVSSTAGGTVTTTQVSSTFSGLTPSTTYYFQVSATDVWGRNTVYSSASAASTPKPVVVGPPTVSSLSSFTLDTSSSIQVNWSAVSGASYYMVYLGNSITTIPSDEYSSYTLTFTNCGASGQSGPTQSNCNTEYTGTNLSGAVSVISPGLQRWTVPETGIYRITTYGAQGGGSVSYPGGLGAMMSGDFSLVQGQILNIIVGQTGLTTTSNLPSTNRGGGGGSFVWVNGSTTAPLIAAGGGGGSNTGSGSLGVDATTTTSGTRKADGSGTGGIGGDGATGGAAGFKTSGTSPNSGSPALGILSGGVGGDGYDLSTHWGGYGGGGGGGGNPSATYASGGGGGYSGGAGQGAPGGIGGGGGGSYNAGTNQSNASGVRSNNGLVVIQKYLLTVTSIVGTATTSNTSYIFSGLTPSTTYYLQIKSVDLYGQISVSSSVTSTRTAAPPAPSSTTITGFTRATSSLQVSWATASGAAYYTVSTTAGATVTTTQTNYTFTGLTANTSYRFQIRSVNTYGATSTFSSASSSLTLALPSTITSFTWPTTSSIQVNWSAVTGTLYYTVSSTAGTVTTTQTSYTFTGLTANTNYTFQVASDLSGFSTASTTYILVGTFVSQIKDIGYATSFGSINWNDTMPTGSSITMELRAGNQSDLGDGVWTVVSKGSQLDTNFDGMRYYQYRATLFTSSTDNVPSVDDVSVSYYGQTTGSLISSPFDTGSIANFFASISWSMTTSTGTTVKFQVRTSPDNNTWTNWVGPDGTNSSYFVDDTGNESIPASLSDGVNDRWIQYRLYLQGDGVVTPVVSSVALTYAVNATPDIAITTSTVVQSSDGTVTIPYDVRDTDSLAGATPGSVSVSLQYCTANCGTPGSETWTTAAPPSLSGNFGSGIVVDTNSTTAYTSYSLTWSPKISYDNQFNDTDFKIRLRADDGEAANNIGVDVSNFFTLDTKDPVVTSIVTDARSDAQNPITLTVSDDTVAGLEMKFSSNPDMSNDGANILSGEWIPYTATSSWVYQGSPAKLYYIVRDAYGNTSLNGTAVLKQTLYAPTNFVYQDTSNAAASDWREFLAWEKIPEPTEGFGQYTLYRSTDGVNYSSIMTQSSREVNFYLDQSVSNVDIYYYKLTVEDSAGNISNYSSIISDLPDGQGSSDVTTPTITNVVTSSISTQSATITWDTDELSSSYVDYTTATGGDFVGSELVGSVSLANTESGIGQHQLVLTNLTPDTVYYFRVRSTDLSGNEGTSGVSSSTPDGFTFTTLPGPIITNVGVSSISNNSVTITWDTDQASDSYVYYASNNTLTGATTASSDESVTSHSIQINHLSIGTTYYYYVKSGIGVNKNVINGEIGYFTFTTLNDQSPPVITFSESSDVAIADHSISVSWTTDEPATTIFEYGTSTAYSTLITDSNLNTSHVQTLSGLTLGTTYYVRFTNTDTNGNTSTAIEFATTTSDTADYAPPIISNVTTTVVTDDQALIKWDTDDASTGKVYYGTTSTTLDLYSAATSTYDRTHGIILSSLNTSTVYYYYVESIDLSGNIATSSQYTFTTLEKLTPESEVLLREQAAAAAAAASASNGGGGGGNSYTPDLTAPTISNQRVTDITGSTAKVTWSSSESSDSLVEFGKTENYNQAGVNLIRAFTHEVNLAELIPLTTYYYRLSSSDSSGNRSTFVTGTFSTILPEVQPETPTSTQTQEKQDTQNVTEQVFLGYMQRAAELIKSMSTQVSVDVLENSLLDQTSIIHELSTLLPRPVIGGQPVVNESANSATVSWTTDKNANSLIEFAPDSTFAKDGTYVQGVGDSTVDTKDHNVDIQGLTPSTLYHYRIISRTLTGAETQSKDFTFTTKAQTTEIASYKINVLSPEEATFVWSTSIPIDSMVSYIPYRNGIPAVDARQVVKQDGFTTEHSVKVSGFEGGVVYNVELSGKDSSGNTTSKLIQGFSTDDTDAPPVISQITTESSIIPGPKDRIQVIISWNTNELSTSEVFYRAGFATAEDSEFKESTQPDLNYTKRHVVVIANFEPASVYQFVVESKDSSGNTARSKTLTILTPQKEQSVFQVILGNFQDLFSWVGKLKQ